VETVVLFFPLSATVSEKEVSKLLCKKEPGEMSRK
jgi:hypothetical protein